MSTEAFYVTGGTIRSDALCYVERRADRELYDALAPDDRPAEFSYVLTSRQMGKSSLMVRTAGHLRAAGVRVAVLDLTAVGQNLTPEQWYGGLLRRLGRQLDVTGELEDRLDDYWGEHDTLGPLQRWMSALRDVVLRDEGLVVFIDEIDAVRSLPFSTDEFFAAIRECYNRRSQDAAFERLTFCLLGVATPSDLIRDTRVTPFNIGRRIELTDFTLDEAHPLLAGLVQPTDSDTGRGSGNGTTDRARIALRRVLYWTGGHPYLTQRLCSALAERTGSQVGLSTSDVDAICAELFLSSQAREKDDNLIFVRERMLRASSDDSAAADLAGLLDLYGRVRAGKRVPADDTNQLVGILRLAGIVRLVDGVLRVRNRIYERVFDREWVQAHMPDSEIRRQRAAYRKGVLRSALVGSAVVALMAGLVYRAGRSESASREASRIAGISADRMELALVRQRHAYAKLQSALGQAETQRLRADREAGRARNQAMRANREAAAARLARNRSDLERRRADESARAAHQQERLARAATEQQRRSARRALELLSLGQAERGIRVLQDGDVTGLLDLLQARKTARDLPEARASRELLWSGWHRSSAGRLLGVMGHRLPVTSLAYSPDRKLLATASIDGAVQLWDGGTGRPNGPPLRLNAAGSRAAVAAAPTLTGAVLAFSPDSRRLAGADGDSVRVWDVDKANRSPVTIRNETSALTFSPDSRHLITIGKDQPARVSPPTPESVLRGDGLVVRRWTVPEGSAVGPPVSLLDAAGRPIRAFPGSFAGTPVVVTNGGRWAAVRQLDGSIGVWDTLSGRMRAPEIRQASYGMALGLSPDAARIAVADSDSVRIWNAVTGQPEGQPLKQFAAASMSFSRDGSLLATGSMDGTARVWDLKSGHPRGPAVRHQGFILALAFDAPANRLATASYDSSARIWDVSPDLLSTERLAAPDRIRSLVFSPRGNRMATAADQSVLLWNARTLQPTGTPIRLPSTPIAILFSPDERLLAVRDATNLVHLLETSRGEPVCAPLRAEGFAVSMVFNRTGRRLAILTAEGVLRQWDTSTGALVGKPLPNQRMSTVMTDFGGRFGGTEPYSPDGKLLAARTESGEIQLIDVATGRPFGGTLGVRPVSGYAFSPDGALLATVNTREVRLWDLRTRRQRGQTMMIGGFSLARLQFDPAGRTLAVQSVDTSRGFGGRLHLWDTSGARLQASIPSQEFGLPVLFSPDGRLVVVSSTDGLVRMWEVAGGKSFGPPMRLSGFGMALTFTPDGSLIETHSLDGSVQLWETATAQPFGPSMRSIGSNNGNQPSLSPDGKLLVVRGEADEWGLWRVPSPPRDLREMELRTWTALGVRINDRGTTEPIPWREWQRLRARLARLDGRDTAPRGAGMASRAAGAEPTPTSLPQLADPATRIPAREPGTPSTLIDLTAHYNAALTDDWHAGNQENDLMELPRGRHTLDGVEWDLRGIVQLTGARLETMGRRYPAQVRGIPVGRSVRRVHLLHATAFVTPDGTQIGSVVLNYAGGHRWEIPIRYGQDARDWWQATDPSAAGARIGWTGQNRASRRSGRSIRLYHTTLPGAMPGARVESMDILSAGTQSAPFVVGVTVD